MHNYNIQHNYSFDKQRNCLIYMKNPRDLNKLFYTVTCQRDTAYFNSDNTVVSPLILTSLLELERFVDQYLCALINNLFLNENVKQVLQIQILKQVLNNNSKHI